MQSVVRLYQESRLLEMETNALLVSAATIRACASRLPGGEVRRFLYEQASLWEACCGPAPEDEPPAAPLV